MWYPHVKGTNEYQVLNFKDSPFGMVVTYSDHFYKERGMKVPRRKKIGIITDKSFFRDSQGRIVCYPSVYWEGAVMSSMTHPLNLKPYHKHQTLPIVTIDDGQYGTDGPTKETKE